GSVVVVDRLCVSPAIPGAQHRPGGPIPSRARRPAGREPGSWMVVPPVAVVIVVGPEIVADVAAAIGHGVGRDVVRKVTGLGVSRSGAVAKAAVRRQRDMSSRAESISAEGVGPISAGIEPAGPVTGVESTGPTSAKIATAIGSAPKVAAAIDSSSQTPSAV